MEKNPVQLVFLLGTLRVPEILPSFMFSTSLTTTSYNLKKICSLIKETIISIYFSRDILCHCLTDSTVLLWSAVFWKLWWPTMKLCLPWVYLCCVVFVYWGLSKLRGKCHFGFLFLFLKFYIHIPYLLHHIFRHYYNEFLKIDDFRPIKFLFQPIYERFKSWVRQPYVCHLA